MSKDEAWFTSRIQTLLDDEIQPKMPSLESDELFVMLRMSFEHLRMKIKAVEEAKAAQDKIFKDPASTTERKQGAKIRTAAAESEIAGDGPVWQACIDAGKGKNSKKRLKKKASMSTWF